LSFENEIKSPYPKSGMTNQKAALLKKTIKNAINNLPHYAETPDFKLGYLLHSSGNIISQEHLEQLTLCSCRSDEEHKAKLETYKKSHPPQPLDLEIIKNRIGYEGSDKQLKDKINVFLNIAYNKPKRQIGRPQKFLFQKYQITQGDRQNFVRKWSASANDYLKIKEKDFDKFLEDNKWLANECLESLILFSLPPLLKDELTKTQILTKCKMIEKRRGLNQRIEMIIFNEIIKELI